MAQKKQVKKNGMSAGKIAAIGAGVAAVSAGAYYFMGPKGKAHQKKAATLIKGMEQKLERKAKPMIKNADKKFIEAVKKIEKNAKKEISKAKKITKKILKK
ncbi:MAG: hypothetical protein WCO65_00920 [bacterium]